MTPPATRDSQSSFLLMHWGIAVLMVVNIVLGEWMPGSIAAKLASIAFIGSSMLWFGLRLRAGYVRRRPYWTRESWLQYLRLLAMPAAATIFVLAMSTETGMGLMAAPKSTSRGVTAILLVLMLLFGALGLARSVDWLMEGLPSDQFTRRSWFGRRRSSATAQ